MAGRVRIVGMDVPQAGDVERFFAGAREGMAVLADAQRELEAHLARRFSEETPAPVP